MSDFERASPAARFFQATRTGAFMQQVAISRGLFTAALLVIVMWGAAQARPFLVPLCIAALLAFLMAPLVRAMQRLRVPEWLAITTSALLLILPVLGILYTLFIQGQHLLQDFPAIIMSIESELKTLSRHVIVKRFELSSYFQPSVLLGRLASGAGQGVQIAIAGIGAALNAGSQLALILLFSIVMLASRDRLHRSAVRLSKTNGNSQSVRMIDDASILIQRFLIARFTIVLIIAAADMVILLAFNLKYALLLATFMGFMTLVPALGFILSVILPILVSLSTGHSAFATLLMFGALAMMSAIENYVLTPKLLGNRLNINALATFVGLFAGGLLWGIWGMLLSVPILGVIRIIFSEIPALQPWGELLAEKDLTNGARAAQKQKAA